MNKIKIILLITLSITSIISIIYTTKPEEYKTKEEINTIDKLEPLKETIKEDIVLIETNNTKLEVSKQSEPEFYSEENYIYIEPTENTKTESIDETTTSDSISEIPKEPEEIQVGNIETDNIEPETNITQPIIEEIPKEETIIISQEESKIEDLDEEQNQTTEKVVDTTIEEETTILKDNIYIIENKYNQLRIQENDDSISMELETLENNQKWNLISLGNDEYKIISTINLDKVLQLDQTQNTTITTNEYQELDTQKWIVKSNNDGYNIISKENNMCLDTESTIQLKECTLDNDNQIFYFKETSIDTEEKIYPDGNYIIKSTIDNNKVLDIENNTNITLSNISNNKSQIWNITYIENGYYKISSVTNNNIVLSIDNNKNTILEKWQDQDNQKWYLKTNIDGSISLISSLNTCININEKNINTTTCNNNDNQKFILEENTKDLIYYGIDISVYQGDINWKEVANSDVEFVIIRAGYGDNWTSQDDKKLINNVKGCEEYNIPYGVYLYSYAINLEGSSKVGDNSVSVSSEIAHILRLLNELKSLGYEPSLGTAVFYDMEDNSTINLGKEKLTSMANKFCKEIENHGYNCGIYANKYWLTTNLDAKSLEENYTIWLAEWPQRVSTYEEAILHSPSYNLTDYKYWQFTSTGTIPGINGNVDLNLGYNIFK